jgi:Ca2+/Na+ antiporter
MSFLSFESYSLGINALIFVIAAALIWIAGTTLERYADAISVRTGLGQAFTGVLLLSTATSLPEVATTITAVALLNNPTLAVYNLLGGMGGRTWRPFVLVEGVCLPIAGPDSPITPARCACSRRPVGAMVG